MLIYKNTFENITTINYDDFPVEDQYFANEKEAIVADGITRDPIGVRDLNSCSLKEKIEKYPRPSGAELAAKEIVTTFANVNGTLKERLIKCNENVKLLNNKYIKKCDYLENDYYGAVASCIHIENNVLDYAFICDCGIIVYDKNGKVKFQTEDEKKVYSDPYREHITIPWNLPEKRLIVRRDYRNNLNNIQNGKCVSFGALTGEAAANEFIRTGMINLDTKDIIILYSDGLVNFLYEPEFIKHIINFNKTSFEKYINMQSLNNPQKYGNEKTIVLYQNN